MKKFSVVALMLTVAFMVSCGGGFYTLKSSRMGGVGPLAARLPYTGLVNYFGFIDPAAKPDGMFKGKNAYYLYFWVPAAIDEVGIAMYSPATSNPGGKDFVGPKFKEQYAKDSKSFFDTYIALERMMVIDAAKIKDGAKAPTQMLGENDDTSEIPRNPGGQAYNSILRIKTEAANPLKALVRSVYRITFTSFRGNVKGSFVAQVGTNIPGVKIAATLEDLHKLVNDKK